MQERELLARARDEIRDLRRENELTASQLAIFEGCMALLHGKAGSRTLGGMSPDIVFEIDRHLLSLKGTPPAHDHSI